MLYTYMYINDVIYYVCYVYVVCTTAAQMRPTVYNAHVIIIIIIMFFRRRSGHGWMSRYGGKMKIKSAKTRQTRSIGGYYTYHV